MDMNITINGFVEKSTALYAPVPGDYVGEDGLIYCGKCHTPKQHRIVFLGEEKTPGIPCRCEAEEIARRERERAEFERLQMLLVLRSECFPDARLLNWNFANSDDETAPLMQTMHKYCDNFSEMYKDGCGLLLYGSVGVGKSFAAACVANELIEQGRSVHMTDFSRIINTLWGLSSEKQKYLDRLNSYDLLIIDDLAAERDTAYANEIVTNVIDSRCRSGKPIIVTTNLSATELFSPQGLSKQRVYSRLCEMCIPVLCEGNVDRRKEKMKSNISKYSEMLGLGKSR